MIEKILTSQLVANENNPRTITEEKMQSLINSILVLPKMLELRPIVVDNALKALGGNMRLHALSQISKMSINDIENTLATLNGFKAKTSGEKAVLLRWWGEWLKRPETPCIKADKLSEEEQREFIIKDNIGFGKWDWDKLANEWDLDELEEWALDIPQLSDANHDDVQDLSNSYQHEFKLEITLNNEEEQEKLHNELIGRGYDVKVLNI